MPIKRHQELCLYTYEVSLISVATSHVVTAGKLRDDNHLSGRGLVTPTLPLVMDPEVSSRHIDARIPEAKAGLLPLLLRANALTFGEYTLKSKRVSPYFFTSSTLHTAECLEAVARAYAALLTSPPFSKISHSSLVDSYAPAPVPSFDVLFGPAYKGIPLASLVTRELMTMGGKEFGNVSYSFNRKEAKDHGEGGTIVGAPLSDKKVVIIDDVMTAGTAMREAVDIIHKQGGTVVGVVLLLNRQERVSDQEARSALGVAEAELKVPVKAVLTLEDIMVAVKDGKIEGAGDEELKKMKSYRGKYGSKD